ncbi:hypothetical protein SAMN06265337_4296 [Hymenobacter gelipurpurascens]|uniref:Uncharacterized protein n=1 Tax=Hymenobacter gelipurpurascens TaxID=89968 RepID=A0A212UHI1_9BACT|nr:hypothetical protein SAMN06265337_4296 [Hymenobacter gelipurpurascens]
MKRRNGAICFLSAALWILFYYIAFNSSGMNWT